MRRHLRRQRRVRLVEGGSVNRHERRAAKSHARRPQISELIRAVAALHEEAQQNESVLKIRFVEDEIENDPPQDDTETSS